MGDYLRFRVFSLNFLKGGRLYRGIIWGLGFIV